MSHAAPYRHFADKNALLFAIAEQGLEKLYAAGVAAMEGADDPLERLDAYGIAYVRFALENPVLLRVMFTLQFEAPPDARDVGAPAFDLLQQAAAEVVGPGVDSYTAAFAAWSLPHGLSMLVLDGRVPPELVEDAGAVEKLARSAYAMWRGATRSVSNPSRRRLTSLDALRGLAVILMIEQHVGMWLWHGPDEGLTRMDYPVLVAFNAIGGYGAPLFIGLTGVGSALMSASQRPRLDAILARRGVALMGFGLLLNLITPSWFSWGSWFALHLMGFSMALSPPVFARLRTTTRWWSSGERL